MSISRQRAVHIMAGTLVVLSVTLAWLVSPWWLILAVFIGVNLTQSGFTGFCPAEKIFGALGLPDGPCEPKRQ